MPAASRERGTLGDVGIGVSSDHPVSQNEHVEARGEKRRQGVVDAADDRLLMHVETGVDQGPCSGQLLVPT